MDEILKNITDVARWQKYVQKATPESQFLVMLLPLFEQAYQQLSANSLLSCGAGLGRKVLEQTIWQDLSKRLGSLISRVCVMEMHSVNSRGFLQGETPAARFQHYVSLIQEPQNVLELLNKYPLLRQQIETVYTQYLAVASEFWQRLTQDWALLQKTFFNDQAITLIDIGTSGDTHRQGRAVSIVQFEVNGQRMKVVYKPRSLAVDVAFNHWLAWINQRSDFAFLQLPVLDCGSYGWCGFIEQKPCQIEAELSNFYRREGALLGILHLLVGSDIHIENLIAHGDQPVIVDLECLFYPWIVNGDTAQKMPQPMVTDTHILPQRVMIDRQYGGFDLSALTGQGGERSLYLAIDWEEAGTDQMRVKREHKILGKSHNLPSLQGQPVDPLTFEAAFAQGFEAMYRLFLQHRVELLGSHSPFNTFAACEVRLVLRATSDYGKLLFESYHPELWYYPEKREQHFDWLRKAVADRPLYQHTIEHELVDLKTGNIPAFYTTVDGAVIVDANNHTMGIEVKQSGLARVKAHLAADFNEQDLALQLRLIHYSFIAARLNQKTTINSSHAQRKKLVLNGKSIDHKQWQARAATIVKQLLTKLVADAVEYDGVLVWPQVEIAEHLSWKAGFCGVELYNGSSGIGLAFALAHQQLGFSAEIAQRCFIDLLRRIDEHSALYFGSVGGFAGVGGLIYALSIYHTVFPKIDIKPAMQKLFAMISELLSEDRYFDLIGGVAGALAGIQAGKSFVSLALFEQITQQLVNHLLTHYPVPSVFGDLGNAINAQQPLLGFSHGVAGMAWALAKYAPQTTEVKAWIEAALIYERHHQSAQGWPDFRANMKRGQCPCAWCHGAPGIGLARVDMPAGYHDQSLHQEIDHAYELTLQQGFGANHNLCHGDWGNLACLWQMAKGNAQREAQVWQIADQLLTQLESGEVKFDQADVFSPGLMTGAAGVVVQLLAMMAPEKILNILLLTPAKIKGNFKV